jgi:nitrogen fixation protein NifB
MMALPGPTSPLERHPCFDVGASRRFGRLHLPVAPRCNIRCGYCNRTISCVHESRPGLARQLLKPEEVGGYLEAALKRQPFISVVGIAGPGDPFATPDRTLKVLGIVRRAYPELLLCLASNGLNLVDYLDHLARLAVDFVTVTINAVDPAIGEKVCSHIRLRKQVLRGRDAASVLLARQLEAVARLKATGTFVKVNTVVIPGINAEHVRAIAARLAGLRVDLQNLIPLLPLPGTPLAHWPAPAPADMARLRRLAGHYLPQMHHCARCRADAAGLLGDRPGAACSD